MIMEHVIEQKRIFREVDMLNRTEQLHLLSYLAKTTARSEEKKYRIANLKGLGKGLWKKNGIDNFVFNERNTWD
jgi:hypothetical protein